MKCSLRMAFRPIQQGRAELLFALPYIHSILDRLPLHQFLIEQWSGCVSLRRPSGGR